MTLKSAVVIAHGPRACKELEGDLVRILQSSLTVVL
jgi:hypothetical protein